MSTATEMLAREMCRLDAAIKQAAAAHNWIEATELEETRERIQATRSSLLRQARPAHDQGGAGRP